MRFQPCLAVLFISLGTLATAFAADSLPNVVLIISDDQAWTDYGFMGHPHIETPNLDQLARQSLTFTRGYVPDSLCRPSLATIITGLHAHQHGIVGNDPPLPPSLDGKSIRQARGSEAYLKAREQYIEHIDRVPTMPKMLGEIGFVSHQSGKWWEGNFRRGGFTHGMTHGDRRRGGRHGDNGLVIGRQGMQPVFEFIDTAVEQNKPFFVWYAPFLPHSPHNPPERLFDKYKDKTDSPHIARYWAMCEWFDETCGQLLKHLDQQGVADNTVVVYVTDNGWINDPSADRYAAKSKRSQYDGGVRTPIMVRWPKKIQPRRDEQTLVSSIDIAPTVLAACGLKPTDAMQGINLMDGKTLEARQRIFGEIFEHDIQHMTDPSPSLRFRWVIDGAMKLIVPHKAREPKAPVELYNLAEDPTETRNLAAEQPEVVAKLTDALDQWWTP